MLKNRLLALLKFWMAPWIFIYQIFLEKEYPAKTILSGLQFYVKMTYYALTYVLLITLWPFFLLLPSGPSNLRILFKIHNLLCRILGIRITVRNIENLNSQRSCVIVCNHQSSLDIIPLGFVCPPNCTIIAKSILKNLIPLGPLSYKSGMIYIDRANTHQSKLVVDSVSTIMRDKELKIWIFPEGKRNSSGLLLPFKKGAFHLAVKAQVPVCPVVISRYESFYSKAEKRFESGNLTVTCLPPLETTGLSVTDIDELSRKARDQMQVAFDEMAKQ